MSETKIICDACRRYLSPTSDKAKYRLSLSSERVPQFGGVVTEDHEIPPLQHTHHFCGLPCLRTWMILEATK